MSNDLRDYVPFTGTSGMSVTAFVGKDWNHAVQFTIGHKWCGLSAAQVRDLITVLQKRLVCAEGYSATDHGDRLHIDIDGEEVL